MIEWWGPIIIEYYGGHRGASASRLCDSARVAGPPGHGRPGASSACCTSSTTTTSECPNGTPGTIWFEAPAGLQYCNDPEKTREATSPDGTMSTVGDVGYVDDDGCLYLTDRKSFMIISGGVNIYPQETENLLITHPKVADAAVFGVPNADLGEEVKAVIQPMPGIEPGPELERRADRVLPGAPVQAEVPARRSTSRSSSPGCPPASCTRRRCATATGARARAASCSSREPRPSIFRAVTTGEQSTAARWSGGPQLRGRPTASSGKRQT